MTGGLAARRIDQPQGLVCDHETGKNARVAQKALEPLMGRGLPAIEGAPLIRIDTLSLNADEELPPLLPIAELGDGPGGREGRVVFGKPNEQLILWNGRAARRAGDMAGLPPQHLFYKSPGIPQGGLRGIRIEQFGDCACIDWSLT